MDKIQVIKTAAIFALITVIILATTGLIEIEFKVSELIGSTAFAIISYGLSVVAPLLYVLSIYIINRKKPKAETLQKTPPQQIEEENLDTAQPAQPAKQQPQPSADEDYIQCECGQKFSNNINFIRHRQQTGHNGTILMKPDAQTIHVFECECGKRFRTIKDWQTHASAVGHTNYIEGEIEATQLESEEKPSEQEQSKAEDENKEQKSLEDIEQEIQMIAKQKELEEQKAELERAKTLTAGIKKIRNDIENGQGVEVIPASDLLTKNGPEKRYFTINVQKSRIPEVDKIEDIETVQ